MPEEVPALLLALCGLLIAAVLTLVLHSNGMTDAKDLTAVAAVFTGITGTLVGTFLGLHVGAAGKSKLQQDRDSAVNKMERALSKLPDEERQSIAEM
jgi:uncharacterized membrane protein SpoIIM required for sporulation